MLKFYKFYDDTTYTIVWFWKMSMNRTESIIATAEMKFYSYYSGNTYRNKLTMQISDNWDIYNTNEITENTKLKRINKFDAWTQEETLSVICMDYNPKESEVLEDQEDVGKTTPSVVYLEEECWWSLLKGSGTQMVSIVTTVQYQWPFFEFHIAHNSMQFQKPESGRLN